MPRGKQPRNSQITSAQGTNTTGPASVRDWIYHEEGLYEFNQDENDNNNEAEVVVIS
ncbi:hypothetical protein PGT21_035305 [Puccinia graminis f. sp. tritici]|uniref:Uncharacterized protein n=2 Tax=Puccinia graminis f. sp. tritici TaxID=56615 RepID=H6QRY3_PUCGT|nr:uncharacterized protein PGTG_21598 [Puccinia graminis f. sp. tritici CRL 75-36-700-3]EHS63467.1 hypothetical protein PGTG_21598 [Puccinia graminis f. sp. tritici CRL 75-36-700-3]KAA1066514.1 hypothetical protein PGT21_032002 [Puccinia graminis f. sp. tritici]KAA1087677.1 hypothetical protein PGT21_035305 [Puccinia graminis f. sp. tritici]